MLQNQVKDDDLTVSAAEGDKHGRENAKTLTVFSSAEMSKKIPPARDMRRIQHYESRIERFSPQEEPGMAVEEAMVSLCLSTRKASRPVPASDVVEGDDTISDF